LPLGVAVALLGAVELFAADGAGPDFGRDIYPIFQRSCFECHGPKVQEAELRLDERTAALDHYSAIVPGDAENSELYRRTTLPAGHEEIMPAVGKPLTQRETELLRRWLEAGAEWPEDFDPPKHWAYVAPVRPTRAEVSDPSWPKSGLDYFVLARLDAEGLQPSPAADRATLIRRVYFDLIGLPPAPAEVAAFLADFREQAYEAVVDRLLDSPHFGERWARHWLDLARYADSHGFQRDDLREIWAYRDWVIRAMNADMPFDEFTIEQLAGDLLPDASEQQKIATGFHRCAMTNVEAGTDPEETRTNQVIDRVNTTATVWLGSTLECAQCHDHKYDSFSQKEYYQFYAFFNSTAIEADRANPKAPASIRFLGPSMKLPNDTRHVERTSLQNELDEIDRRIGERATALRREASAWEAGLRASLESAPRTHVLDLSNFASAEGAAHRTLDDKSVLLSDDPPDTDTYTFSAETALTEITAFKLETLLDDSLPGGGPGRSDAKRPNFVLNTFAIEAAPRGSEQFRPVRLVKATADYSQRGYHVAGAIDDDPKTAWAISPRFFSTHWAQFQTGEPVGFETGMSLRFRMVQRFGGGRTIGRLRISAITGNPTEEAIPSDVARILQLPPESRSKANRRRLQRYRAERDATIARLRKKRSMVQVKLRQVDQPTTLVMQELPEPRPTMLFERGDYKQLAEPVEPGVPAILHAFTSAEPDRLSLAQWLVDRQNPLVARVTVNRWWAEIFGRGIVETVEDFGIKGQPPTHPKLLDWLAVEFMESGWSMKKVLREIVTSATYRQSSAVTPELLERDDQNKLYARGPRMRMDAEMIRDNALAISGLLSRKQFGPPIRPYQPDGLWVKVGGARVDYEVSPGEDRYRRGIYVVLKRGAPYPSFVNFDGSARLACSAKRSRSNTPLQALTLLNDPVYVEAAQALAVRTLRECAEGDVGKRIDHMLQICLCREASARERAALRRLYDEQLRDAHADRSATRALVGGLPLAGNVSREELAAWYAVAMVLMNLDETITKG
jgi:Protein of unknown function (DUF1553)/Protein of unknown function (DUF1549)/Planctomycete cytochrome C